MTNGRIKDLQAEIERERRKMNNCPHTWGKSFYCPETKSEPYGHILVGQGSDVYYEPEGYRDVKVPRWGRTCEKCGYIQYTYKQETIVIKSDTRPKF